MHSKCCQSQTRRLIAATSATITLLFTACWNCAFAAASTIYITSALDGLPIYSDRPLGKTSRVLVHVAKLNVKQEKSCKKSKRSDRIYREVAAGEKIDAVIRAASLAYAVDEQLLHAVIHVESAYDPNAVSRAGAVGLMQLMPATAARFGVQERTNVRQNVSGGTRYLRYLIDLFDGDLTLALAAYNAGEGAVLKYGSRVPPFTETRNYVKRVLQKAECNING